MDPDRLAELEDERRFLLRSLRDLDAELAAGDVDATDYATLRDGYTKRAADVLRSIEEGKAALPPTRPGRWRRNLLAAAIVVAVAVGAGDPRRPHGRPALAGGRHHGRRRTGRHGDPAGAGAGRCSASTPRAAQDLYRRCSKKTPRTRRPSRTRGGCCTSLRPAPATPSAQTAVQTAKEQLTKAVAADATYPDPHCFLAIVALRVDADATTSQAEQQRCLDLDPPAQIRNYMQQLTAPTPGSMPASTVPG